MKISRLKKLAGVFFALVLGTSTVFSQGRQNRYMGNNRVQQQFGINQLDDLSEKQKNAIADLREKHFTAMAALREKRQTVQNPEININLRDEMIDSILTFKKEVYGILTPEQQKQFDKIHLRKELSLSGNRGMKKGNENRQGFGKSACRGYCLKGSNNSPGNRGRFRNGSCKNL